MCPGHPPRGAARSGHNALATSVPVIPFPPNPGKHMGQSGRDSGFRLGRLGVLTSAKYSLPLKSAGGDKEAVGPVFTARKHSASVTDGAVVAGRHAGTPHARSGLRRAQASALCSGSSRPLLTLCPWYTGTARTRNSAAHRCNHSNDHGQHCLRAHSPPGAMRSPLQVSITQSSLPWSWAESGCGHGHSW